MSERRDPPVRLGIVVVNYRSSRLLRQHLASLDRTALVPSTVVVVDNHSTDAERRAVEALVREHGWELVASATNVGFGAAANRGVGRAAEAGCTTFLLLNPDVAIDSAAVAALVAAGTEQPRALLTPRLVRPDGSTWFAGGQLDRSTGLTRSRPDHHQQGPDRWLTGACLLVGRACWDALGGFDERYFLYWEDVDLSQRVLAAGGDLRVLHDVVAVHQVGATQRAEGKSLAYAYYMCRNRLLFALAHLGPGARLRWLVDAPRYAARVTLRDGRRALLRRPSLAAAALAGTVAGAVAVLGSLLAGARRWSRRRVGHRAGRIPPNG